MFQCVFEWVGSTNEYVESKDIEKKIRKCLSKYGKTIHISEIEPCDQDVWEFRVRASKETLYKVCRTLGETKDIVDDRIQKVK